MLGDSKGGTPPFAGGWGGTPRFITSPLPLPRERGIQGVRVFGIASIANDVNKGNYSLADAMQLLTEEIGI